MLRAMSQGQRRVKVSAEVIVEITDDAALRQAVLEELANTEFSVDPGETLAGVRAAAQQDVKGDPACAVSWIATAEDMIPEIPGVEVIGSSHRAVEVGQDGRELEPYPDFAQLFPLCECGKDDCDACSGFQVTPRTAAVLWAVARLLADHAYNDVHAYGDEPLVDDTGWMVFGDYPRITWRRDAVWRRQAARAFDDLAEDLEAGKWPRPTCPGEEMALHLMLRSARDAVDDDWAPLDEILPRLPEHRDDYEWDMASEVLLQDNDVLSLFNATLDGVEDPEAEYNKIMGMGDYRPEAWFRPFLNATPRDGRRGFRR